MADKIISYGATEGFGALAGWESKGTNVPDAKTRAVAANKTGDEVASKLHDQRQDATENLECNNDTNTIPAVLGALLNTKYILTGIEISTTLDAYASLVLTGHNHTNNAHADTLRKCTHGLALAKCFGCTDFMNGTPGDNASPISSSASLKIDHVDQNDMSGDHLVGENYNPLFEAKTTWAGVPTLAAEAGWDVTVQTDTDERTGFQKTEVTGTQRLTIDP